VKPFPKILGSLAALALAAPAAAAAAPVDITGFSVSPSCVQPGGTITTTVTVHNNNFFPTNLYGQPWATEGGVEVYRGSVSGPYTAPPLISVTQSLQQQIPVYTPWGYYSVNFGIGPSNSSPTSWSQRSATLVVSPVCW
jgi:hypothetical protein